MIKINFRSFNPDWVELGIIANFLGISRIALFAWFLLLDFAGWGEILREHDFGTGVPTKISPIIGNPPYQGEYLVFGRGKSIITCENRRVIEENYITY